jgi:protein SCO1
MTRRRSAAAVAALGAIAVITAAWWALALWRVGDSAPEWMLRTRLVCFGASGDGLPDAAGWTVLIGQPLGMLALLAAVWGAELRAGLRLLISNVPGQLATGAALALVVTGAAGVAARVRTPAAEPFDPGGAPIVLTRVDDPAPALALTDQAQRTITLESLRGRPVLVTFAYAHCETVCPLTVSDVLAARRQLREGAPELLVITLDPWRDTRSRLPSIAETWGLQSGEHVLSGDPEEVERILSAWRVPRSRNQRTGDISHPAMVYVVSAEGRIRYVVNGGVDVLVSALRALPAS